MIDVVHSPQNEMDAEEVFVWVSVDDDGEGIIAVPLPGIQTSALVMMKRRNAELAEPMVRQALQTAGGGKGARLLRFVRAEVVKEIKR